MKVCKGNQAEFEQHLVHEALRDSEEFWGRFRF